MVRITVPILGHHVEATGLGEVGHIPTPGTNGHGKHKPSGMTRQASVAVLLNLPVQWVSRRDSERGVSLLERGHS